MAVSSLLLCSGGKTLLHILPFELLKSIAI